MLVGDYFGNSIAVAPAHDVLAEFRKEWHGVGAFVLHGVSGLPFWLALAGIAAAWYLYLANPALPARIARASGPIYTLLENKYYFDRFNAWFFAGGARALGAFLSRVGDLAIIDGFFVNGSARVVGWTASLLQHGPVDETDPALQHVVGSHPRGCRTLGHCACHHPGP